MKFKNPLFVVVFTIFIDMLGYGILIPIIPQLLTNPHSPEYLLPAGWTMKTGYIALGFLTAIFPLMQFIATPILGQLSDHFGRKKVLAISIFGTSISYFLFAIGIVFKNIPLLFISRGFDGITGGNIAVAQAAIADITKPQDRAKNFGLMGAAFGFGFIIGPYLGGKLADPSVVSWFNAATPFWFAGILAFINMLFILTIFPETIKEKIKGVLTWDKAIRNIITAVKSKTLRGILGVNFLYQGGFTFYTTFASVFFITRYAFTPGRTGDYFAYVGIWIAITQAVVNRLVSKRFNEKQVLSLSLLLTGIGVFCQYSTQAVWQVYTVTPFFAMAIGLSQANLISSISKRADSHVQGEVLGINASVQALAQSIPPILSGYIAASISPTMPLVIAGVVTIVAWLMYMLFVRSQNLPQFNQEL